MDIIILAVPVDVASNNIISLLDKLNENALPIIDKRDYKISPIQINKNEDLNDHLIVFDNETHIESLELKNYKKIYFVLPDNKARSLKLDLKVLDFKKKILISQLKDRKLEDD